MDILAGSTSKLIHVFIADTSFADGRGLTGLVFNSAGLTGYYLREGASSATAITFVTASVGTFTSSGFKEVDATNMPGVYEIGIPDAAIAAGAASVKLHLKGATNMAVTVKEISLVAYNPQDAVRLGLTALPNANANASGGLPTAGTGTNQISLSGGNVAVGSIANNAVTAASINADAITAAKIASDVTTEIAAGISIPSAATIADAVWDEARSGHVTGGSFGEGVIISSIANNAVTAAAINADAITAAKIAADVTTEIAAGVPSASSIADAVWSSSRDATLKSLVISNSGGNAITLISTGSNGSGLSATGHGSGAAISGYGGQNNGPGFLFEGGTNGSSTAGPGGIIRRPGEGVGSADGLTISGTVGVNVTGGITAAITGNITGNLSGSVGSVSGNVGGNVTGSVGSVVGNVGGNVTGSVGSVVGAVGSISGITFPTNFGSLAIDGDGIVEANAVLLLGDDLSGNNATLKLKMLDVQNDAGDAAYFAASGSSHRGMHIVSGTSNGLEVSAGAGSGHAILLTGGASGGDGLRVNGSGAGVDIRAGITGDITGNLSGSVGSVSGNVGGNVTGSVGSVVGNVGGNVTGSVASVVGNVGGNVTGSVASVVGNVGGNVTGNVGGNVTGTIGGLTAAAIKDFFDTDSTTTYASAVSGSVVKEIASNAAGSGGGITLATGTVSASHTNTDLDKVKLATSASLVDDFYNGETIAFSNNQARTIVDYDGGNRFAYFDHNLRSQLVGGTTTYSIIPATARADAMLDLAAIESGVSVRKVLRALFAFVAGGRKKPSSDVIEFYAGGQAATGTPRVRFNSVDSQGQTGTSAPDLNLT